MLVLPNTDGLSDVDRNYVDVGLEKKVNLTTYQTKIQELEMQHNVIYETVEG